MGDTSRTVDIATLPSASPGVRTTIVSPDTIDAGNRSDALEAVFTELTPGRFASIATDLDLDDADSTEDSTVSVEFSDGSVLPQTWAVVSSGTGTPVSNSC